jgi:hypothetical protein
MLESFRNFNSLWETPSSSRNYRYRPVESSSDEKGTRFFSLYDLIGHVICLTQVNRQLRYSLTNDNGYWVFLLRTRLNVKLPGKRRNNALFESIRRLSTLRCADCHTMQLPRRPFIQPFWNRPLCDVCRLDDKYRLVTAYTGYSQEELFVGRKRPPGFANIQSEEPSSQTRFTSSILFSCRCSATVRTEATAIADDTDRSAQEKRLEESTS